MQSVAQHEYEDMDAEEAKALKMPKIVKHKSTAVETPGIKIAKEIWKRSNQNGLHEQTLMDLAVWSFHLLQAAGEEIATPKGMSPEQLAERIAFCEGQEIPSSKEDKKAAASASATS